jgi:hypothetical protein
VKIDWCPAEPPLLPVAVAAGEGMADVLAAKASGRDDLRLTRFAEWSVVEGPDLPWVDGAVYLGRLPGATDVLVPVHRLPNVHPELVHHAARSLLAGRQVDRVGVVPVGDRVVVLPLVSKP